MKKHYTMTLIEIMVVIFIIGLVGSVLAYNMRGSLDQGKAFKTKEAAKRLYEIILLEKDIPRSSTEKDIEFLATKDHDTLFEKVKEIVINSDLIRHPKDIMQDGWGTPFIFKYDDTHKDIRFSSEKYETYCEKKKIKPEYPWEDVE